LANSQNHLLQDVIGEARPDGPAGQVHHGQYGMPSSHAQFMGFYSGYLLLLAAMSRGKSFYAAGLAALGAIVLAALVAAARVYLYYHTMPQVCNRSEMQY